MKSYIKALFNPSSIAVIGASREKGKVGYEIFENLYKETTSRRVYPVNPKANEINGVKCYRSIKDIPDSIDMAVIVVPAKSVSEVLRDCAERNTKVAIVISAGFKETGEEGRKLEEELVSVIRSTGIRVLGPNCLGIMVPPTGLNASFGAQLPPKGSIGFISQSGALLTAVIDLALGKGIGFSSLISIGNKADLNELDMLEALAEDEETKVIAGYLENVTSGQNFARKAEEISKVKPILLVKGGVTQAGAQAASSHTGSLAGSEVAYECLFARAGIIHCECLIELFDYAVAFSNQPLPKGPSVAILTNAGGPGILAADQIEKIGLNLAKLSDKTKSILKEHLPSAANINNPVDVLGDALEDRYELALKALLEDPGVDAIIVLLTPQAMTRCEQTAEVVVKLAKEYSQKTIVASFMGEYKLINAHKILRQNGIPNYNSPVIAVKTLKTMYDHTRWKMKPKRVVKIFPVNRRKVATIIDRHLRRKEYDIGEMEAKEIISAYGFVIPKSGLAVSAEQAVSIANQIGYPVVLKIWSPDIIHKSDVGGVRIGLSTPQEVMDAFDLMMYRIPKKKPNAYINGVLVEEMCSKGIEVILGMKRDPQLGPLMMFGMGGIFVEVMKDVSFYLAPITHEEALQMLKSTKSYQLLIGARGQSGVNVNSVAEALQRLSQLSAEFPQITEIDINPFIVRSEGNCIAVDARMKVAPL